PTGDDRAAERVRDDRFVRFATDYLGRALAAVCDREREPLGPAALEAFGEQRGRLGGRDDALEASRTRQREHVRTPSRQRPRRRPPPAASHGAWRATAPHARGRSARS